MLNFICGTSEVNKVQEIYRRAKEDAAAGRNVFILVPEQYSMNAEKNLISTLGISAQNKIQILTFSRLCNLIFSKMGPLRTNYIDKAGKHIMTRRALLLSANELSFFKRNINQRGFVTLVSSAISEFKRYGVTTDSLFLAADKTSDPRLSLKLRDLSVIYKKFNSLVAENHSNSEDNLSMIIPKIKSADFLGGSFYINLFRSFTPTEYAVLAEIMKKADVTVALCTDKTDGFSDIFSAQIHTYKTLAEKAKEQGIPFSSPVFINEDSSLYPDLLHLKQNFFSYSPRAFDGKPAHIHLLRPDNYYDEVVCCARLIRRLVRECGYTFNDILILTGGMESYELLIPQIFEEYDITFFLDKKTALSESPLMRMILSVLEILAYGFSYERIMRIARSGFFPVSREDTDIFENYILAAAITPSGFNTRKDWAFNPDAAAFDMEYINCIKKSLIHPVLDLSDMFSGRKTPKTIVENLFSWMTALNIPEIVNKKISLLRDTLDPEAAEQLRMVWNSFIAVSNQISDYMQSEFFTFAEFYELFSSACSELSFGIVPPTQDKVVISPVDLFRSTGCKVVILLGALEGVFPRSINREGLFSDAERLILSETGLTLAPDNLTGQREEQFLVYSVLTTPQNQLFVFAPLSDRDGKSLKPSDIVYTLKSDLFPDLKELSSNHNVLSLFESRKAAFRNLSEELFKNSCDKNSLSPLWKAVFEKFSAAPQYSKQLDAIFKMHSSQKNTYAISPDTAKKLYGDSLIMSVSKLEKYNACAFSYFMQYGLLAAPRLLGGLKPTDTGTLLHSVLCDYFKKKSKENADYSRISREDCFEEISVLVDTASQKLNESLYANSNYYKYMMLRMKNIATSTAWKLIRFYSQSDFRPSGFEISFGENGKFPSYTLDTTHGKVLLKGFIDRVDSAEFSGQSYISITDYKSSERKLDMDLAGAGIHFQPLIYANALSKHLPDVQIAAMFYLQMNDPIIQCSSLPTDYEWEKGMNDGIKAHGIILDDAAVIQAVDKSYGEKDAIHYIECSAKSLIQKELLEEELKAADKKAAETAENILDGKIDINPLFISGFDPCQFCPYSGICLKNS